MSYKLHLTFWNKTCTCGWSIELQLQPEEVPIALRVAWIWQAGGYVTTSESAAFQLQRKFTVDLELGQLSPQFKPLSQIIKEKKENVQKLVPFVTVHYPCKLNCGNFSSWHNLDIRVVGDSWKFFLRAISCILVLFTALMG